MKINLNQKELSLLTEILWKKESDGDFQTPSKIKVFCGAEDGSDDHWIQPTEDDFYNLANKMQNSLCEEFEKNKKKEGE